MPFPFTDEVDMTFTLLRLSQWDHVYNDAQCHEDNIFDINKINIIIIYTQSIMIVENTPK